MSAGGLPLPKAYPSVDRTPTRSEVIAYATAVGECAPVHLDLAAAQAAGFPDVVAPALFVSVLLHEPLMDVVRDPVLGIDLDRTVVGEQTFDWHAPICAGERTRTQATVLVVEPRGRHRAVEVRTTTHVGAELRAAGLWVGVERGSGT